MALTDGQLAYLQELRVLELEQFLPLLEPGSRVLDYGAGPGHQAVQLRAKGFDVAAVDLASSNYAEKLVFPVAFYDGRTLPFADASFDAVVSSNVLEHVVDLGSALQEMRRVLRPGGAMVHAVPTTSWRFWTTLVAFPNSVKRLIYYLLVESRDVPRGSLLPLCLLHATNVARRVLSPWLMLPHGETGNALTELLTYRQSAWTSTFERFGFKVVGTIDSGIFYSGNMFLGRSMSFPLRRRLSRRLGAGCRLYLVETARARSSG